MASKGNLRVLDDSGANPNDQETTKPTTQPAVYQETTYDAISAQSSIGSGSAVYSDMPSANDKSPNDTQKSMAARLSQKQYSHLQCSSNLQENVDTDSGTQPSWTKKRTEETIYKPVFSFKIPISAAQATMLKIQGFDQCYGSIVEITLYDRHGQVTIKTNDDNELCRIQIRMHDCLDKILTSKKYVQEEFAEFLDTGPCRKYLNGKLNDERIEAVIDSDTHSCELVGYALTETNLDNAFKVLDETLITTEIQLQPHEVDAVNIIVDKVNQTNTQLSRIFMSSRTVKIYSLDTEEADEIQRTIRNAIRELKPKDVSFTASVELSNAKARCFNQHISSDLASAIRQRNGQYRLDESGNDDNIKVTITVVGDPGLKDLLEQTVNKICNTRFDFSKVSTDADDKWLIMRGLSGEEGRTFLKYCEVTFNCFIDMSQEGTVSPPSGKSRVEVLTKDDTDPSSSSDDDMSSSVDDNTDHDKTPIKEKSARQTYHELNGDIVDEDAAFKLAIKQSLEGMSVQNTTDTNTSCGSECDVMSRMEQAFSKLQKPVRGKFPRQRSCAKYKQMQGDVDHKDALKLALQQSKESSNQCSRFYGYEAVDPCGSTLRDNSFGRETLEVTNSTFAHTAQSLERSQYIRQFDGYEPFARDGFWTGDNPDIFHDAANTMLTDEQPMERFAFDQSYIESDSDDEDVEICRNNLFNGMQVQIVKGDITKQKVDALVNIVSQNMHFGKTKVSQAFKTAGGQKLEMEYNTVMGLSDSRIIVTSGSGQLKCKVVLHVGLLVGQDKCKDCLCDTILQILQECHNHECQSVALPPLGIGQMYKYTTEDCAEQTFLSLNQYDNSSPLKVKIVVYDDQTFRMFEKALNSAVSDVPAGLSRLVPRPLTISPIFNPTYSPYNDMLSPGPGMPYHANMLVRSRVHAQASPFKQNAPVPTFNQPSNQSVLTQPLASTIPRHCIAKYRTNKSKQPKHATFSTKSYHDKHGSKKQKETKIKRVSHEPVTNTIITVYAKDKSTCMNALKEMGRKMKYDLLSEQKIDKITSLSKEAKFEITKVIDEHKLLSIKEEEHFILKGKRKEVIKAHSRIKEIMHTNPGSSNKSRQTIHPKRETVEYAQHMSEEEPTIPKYWKHYKEGSTLKKLLLHCVNGKDYEEVDISPTSTTYKTIVRMVRKTTDKAVIGQGTDAFGLGSNKYSKLWVTKIQRVENLSLFKKYCQKRQELFEQLVKQGKGAWPKVENLSNSSGSIVTSAFVSGEMSSDLHPEINEVLLFHGTKLDTIVAICQGGWDNRLANSKAMFGQGVYGAEKPTKADQYTDEKSSRTFGPDYPKKMFLMRMLLGNCFICTDQSPHKYRRPPCCTCQQDDCKQHLLHYDSVIGDKNNKLFREFVVYEKNQCYPEYLITYERR